MSSSPDRLFLDALELPADARADLTDRLIASLEQSISPDVEKAQLDEVERRIGELKSGNVKAVSGEAVLTRIRGMISDFRPLNSLP